MTTSNIFSLAAARMAKNAPHNQFFNMLAEIDRKVQESALRKNNNNPREFHLGHIW